MQAVSLANAPHACCHSISGAYSTVTACPSRWTSKKGILGRQKRTFISRKTQELAEILSRQMLPALLDRSAKLRNIG